MRGATPLMLPGSRCVRLGLTDVGRLKALRAARHFELHAITFGQALEALRLDGAEMNEHVLATLLRDESEALRVVEPLHCSLCHDVPLFSSVSMIGAHAP